MRWGRTRGLAGVAGSAMAALLLGMGPQAGTAVASVRPAAGSAVRPGQFPGRGGWMAGRGVRPSIPYEGVPNPNEILLVAIGTFTSSTGRAGSISVDAEMDAASGAASPATVFVSFGKYGRLAYESHYLNFGDVPRSDFTLDPNTNQATLDTGSDLTPFGHLAETFNPTGSTNHACQATGKIISYTGTLSDAFHLVTDGSQGVVSPELPKSKWGVIDPVTWTDTSMYVAKDCTNNPPPPPTVFCNVGTAWDTHGHGGTVTWDWAGSGDTQTSGIWFSETKTLAMPAAATADTFDRSTLSPADLTFTPLSPGGQVQIATAAAGTYPNAKYFAGQATDTQNSDPTTSHFHCQNDAGNTKTQTETTFGSAHLANAGGTVFAVVKDSFLGGRKLSSNGLPSTFVLDSVG